jgi:CspA family cold shock protein
MITGIVKNWDASKGWGFIEDEDGYDYFINISNVRKGQKLKIGAHVKFDVFQGQRGDEAENVSLI